MAQRLRTLRILWFALLVSVGLYAVVLVFLRNSPNAPTDFAHSAVANTFLAELGLPAFAIAVASLLVPSLLLKRALSKLGGSSDYSTFGLDADSGSITQREFAAYQASYIVGMGMSESVALFGFVLGYLRIRAERSRAVFRRLRSSHADALPVQTEDHTHARQGARRGLVLRELEPLKGSAARAFA